VRSTETTAPGPLPSGLRLLVAGGSLYLLAVHVWTWILTTPLALAGRADFRQFYAAGAILQAGEAHKLYDYSTQKTFQDSVVSPAPTALPFVSPAYHALLFLPLSSLPYRTAYFAFLAMNVGLLGAGLVLMRPWMQSLRAIFRWLPAAMFASFMPIVMALIQGQDSILLTTLLIGSLVLLAREQDFYAGLLTGLGLFKLQIVLPLALLFLIWRRWRFSSGFALSAGTVTLFSVLLTGVGQAKLYVKTLLAIAGILPPPSDLARYPLTLEQMANLHGLVYGLCSRWLPVALVHMLAIFLSLAVLMWTARKGLCIKQSSTQLLLGIPCSVLISHHTYVHDLSGLFLPLIVLINAPLAEATPDNQKKFVGGVAGLAFVAPVLESFSASHFYLISIVVLGVLALVMVAAHDPSFDDSRLTA